MASLDFFRNLGLFIKEDFLSAEFCQEFLFNEARSATIASVKVLHRSKSETITEPTLDEKQRITGQIKVSQETESFLKERLIVIKPMLERHFNLVLTDCQKPLFYFYKEKSFFGIHQDCVDTPGAPEFAKQRRVSVIIFLNDMEEKPTSNAYCGGALTFYGLIDDPRWQPFGFPFKGKSGMLVAFRSDIWHEVKPVTNGKRYTVVSWFV